MATSSSPISVACVRTLIELSITHRPIPLSPVHKHRKFSAVFGTTSARNSISIRPLEEPPMVMSKKTTGLSTAIILLSFVVLFVVVSLKVGCWVKLPSVLRAPRGVRPVRCWMLGDRSRPRAKKIKERRPNLNRNKRSDTFFVIL